MSTILRTAAAFLIYSCLSGAPIAAQAEAAKRITIPAGELNVALESLVRQTGIQLLYDFRQVEGLRTHGVRGAETPQAAVSALLKGTSLTTKTDESGAILISVIDKSSKTSADISQVAHLQLARSETESLQQENTENRTSANSDSSADRSKSSTSAGLDEIVVTAQKRAESIKDVPISITAISGDQLEAARISNALDLSFAVPGLAVAETGAGRQIIVVRGIGSERGSSSLTGIYLDEMPVTGAQNGFVASYVDLRTTDLERVEVLKGPQGTLFGEGAVGGVLRFVTNDPVLEGFDGSLTTSFYSTRDGGESEEVVGIANLPLVKDKFGLRVAATYENKAGWIDQPSIGRKDINSSEVYNVRVKGLWAPTPQMKIKGMVVVHHNDGGASNIVNQEPLDDSIFLQALGGNGQTFDRAATTGFTDEYKLYNLTATYDFGFAELLSSTSRADMDSIQSFTQLLGSLPAPSLEILVRGFQLNATITSQELRLTSSGDGPVNWTVGGFYKDSEMVRRYARGYDVVIPSIPLAITGGEANSTPHGNSESLAAYADLSYAVTDRFKIGGGLRYFYDKRESFDTIDVPATFLAADFDALTFRAYASYAATQGVHLYASVGNGFRSGGFNTPALVPLGANATYDPESVISYEAGIKTVLFDRRVSFDAALFFSEYQDMQDDTIMTSPVDGVSLVQFTVNQQSAELKGVEWDLSWKATDSLTLSFAGDVTDTEITRATSASPYDVGDPINFVPEYQLAATATYRFNWANSMPGFFRADFNRQGKSIQTLRRALGPPQGIAPEVDFLNVSIGLERNGWEMALFGRNLTDERGIIRASATGATAQARPRTVGVTLGKKF